MDLSWSTFALEVVNFLVLVWILKRFLYRPVLDVIARRRAAIDGALAEAQTLHSAAEALQHQYEGRLADWERERQQARAALALEMDAERARRLQAQQLELDQTRERSAAAEARRLADADAQMCDAALHQGARFATRLLGRAAGAETETRLIAHALDELAVLGDERTAALRGALHPPPTQALVSSAYPIDEPMRRRLEQAIGALAATAIAVEFSRDETLLAGVRITLGAWSLGLNLADELAGFVALADGD